MHKYDPVKIGENLRTVRTARDLRQTQIADTLKVSKQLVSHWETARSELTLPHLIKLSEILQVPINTLLFGDEKQDPPTLFQSMGRPVPLLTKDELLDLAVGRFERQKASISQTSWRQCSPQSVCFGILDRAMSPTFGQGDFVVVDPEIEPEPGDCITVALPKHGEILFRRYRPPAGSKMIEPPYSLSADDAFYEPRTLKKSDHPVYLGTLTEHIRLGARG